MASHRPTMSEEYSDALSNASDVSSVNELPATGVPLRYPSPRADLQKGVSFGQVAFPPIAPQGFSPANPPPPSMYPAPPKCVGPDYTVAQSGKGDIETGRPTPAQVVIPRLPLDTLHHPGKGGNSYQKGSKAPSTKYLSGFTDKSARIGFLRRVLWIVVLQMGATSALSTALLFCTSAQDFLIRNSWAIWLPWMAAVCLLFLGKYAFNRIRRSPNKLLFLLIFTAAMASSISTVVGRFESATLFLMVILAFSLVLFLAAIASMTRVDVTNWVPLLMSSFIVVFSAAVIGALWLNAVLGIVIAATGSMVFAMYVVYDVQSLLTDTEKCLDPDEYIVGACAIYLDLVNVLTGCLSMCKGRSK